MRVDVHGRSKRRNDKEAGSRSKEGAKVDWLIRLSAKDQ